MQEGDAPHAGRLDQWYAVVREAKRIAPDDDCREAVAALVAAVERLAPLAAATNDASVQRGHVAPALASWMALCSAAGVDSVEAMIWGKYPRLCPHCLAFPHDTRTCTGRTAGIETLDWPALSRIAASTAGSRPATLAGWQRMFAQIYDPPARATAVARLAEELQELVDAIERKGPASRRFRNEASDVLAWIMQLQNALDRDSGIADVDTPCSLERAIAAALAPSHEVSEDVAPSASRRR